MARSLSRNTELYISTLATGIDKVTAGNNTPQNLFEVKVLDGYSFSQDVSNIEIGVNEAGETPVRGTLAFNTSLNPVDVSFSTYVRPFANTVEIDGTVATAGDMVERVLWASAMGTDDSWNSVTSTGAAASQVITAQDATSITMGLDTSNDNALMPLTLYFKLEKTTYVITNFNVSASEVDFSIDGIATVNWSGQGSLVTEDQTMNATIDAFVAGTNYQAVPTTSANSFLRNKLSALTLEQNSSDTPEYATGSASIASVASNTITFTDATGFTAKEAALQLAGDTLIGGRIYNEDATTPEYRTILSIGGDQVLVVDVSHGGLDADDAANPWEALDECLIYTAGQSAPIVYDIPITGATLTLENNFTYLTPEELAIVNLPLAGFAGNRVISGSLTAYLNTGAEGSGGLLQDMLAKIEDSVTNNYKLVFKMGGASGRRVEYTLNTCQLTVPSTSVEDIISTEISFTAKPTTGAIAVAEGSFEATNEMTFVYYAS